MATELAKKCNVPPQFDAEGNLINAADIKCCTSNITLAEFKTLQGKMDSSNPNAATVEEYMNATPNWRTDLYSARGTLVTHAESIELFKSLGVKRTPELKAPSIKITHAYSQEDYAQQMIDEYKTAGVSPRNVYAQSFNPGDVQYWIEHEPAFGKQAVYLDDIDSPDEECPSVADLADLKAQGVNIIAPPTRALPAVDDDNRIIPSAYALNAKEAGLEIITWTLERSGLLREGGGWNYQSITSAVNNDGDMLEVLDVLARDIGVIGVFSDWPATVFFYADCMGLK